MNKNSKEKIIIIQPGYAHYREQLFRILSKRHDIHFLFERSINTYPGVNRPVNLSCTFLDHGYGNSSIHLIYYLIKHQPTVVISSVSSSLRSIISFTYAILFRKRFILWILEWRKPAYSSNSVKNLLRFLKKLIGHKIILSCHSLIVGGSASKEYALSLRKANKDIFLAMQSANDLRQHKKVKKYKSEHQIKKYTFLYLGRVISLKGLDILLKAFNLLRSERNDINLLIGGDGPFCPYCKKIAESLQIQDISFLGPVNAQSAVDLYQKSDIFILPSYFIENSYEAWGLAINEAMSMNLPVITTKAVGAAYDLVINGFNGFVIKENDVKSLYKAMNKMLKMNLIRMGMNSRILFDKKNNFNNMANGFTSAIEHSKSK